MLVTFIFEKKRSYSRCLIAVDDRIMEGKRGGKKKKNKKKKKRSELQKYRAYCRITCS